MGLHHQPQTKFSGGQVSPLMAGRVDTEVYGTMLATLENMVVQKQGGVIKRQGTYFISELDDSTKEARLIAFQFSTTQAYILEFSKLTMRVFKDGGIVQGATTAWADVTAYALHECVTHSAVTYRCISAHTSAIANDEPGVGPNWTTYWVVASDYIMATPYSDSDVADLKFVQSADTMFLVHPDYIPYELTRTGHNVWTITAMAPVWGPFLDENDSAITITPSAVTGVGISLTASAATFSYNDAGFSSDHIGSLWQISGPQTKSASIGAAGNWTGTLEMDAGESLVVSISGTWVATVTLQRSFDDGTTWLDYITYTANASTEVIEARDGVSYRLGVDTGDYTSGTVEASISIPDKRGYAEITAIVSTTVATATVIEELPSTSAVTTWSEGAWSDLRGYPRAIAFYELRLVFAATTTHPQTIWATQTDDFTNFKSGTEDSDAWTYQLAAENVNSILSLVTSSVLFILTAGGEWRIGGATATTPTNVDVKRESTDGAYDAQGFKAGHVVFFIHRTGRSLRMLLYNYRIDGWETHDVSFISEDLFEDGVEEILLLDDPTDTIWIRRSDGHLIACNFDLVNTTFAYSDHDLGGVCSIESMATIPGTDYDEVWVLVNRTIDGGTVRYVEQFQSHLWADSEDAVFMDSTLSYSGVAVSSLSGLDHLEGETVDILGDGATHAQKTVSSGSVTFDRDVEVCHVGLGYTAKLKTLKLEVKTQTGSAQTQPIDTVDVSVRLNNTIGMDISTDDSDFDVVPFRDPSMEMDQQVDMFTGDTVNIELDSQDDYRGAQITLRNTQPLPFNVLGIFPTLRT